MRDDDPHVTPGLKLGEGPPRVPVGIEGAIGAAIMAALALITFANVLARYFTNASVAFTEPRIGITLASGKKCRMNGASAITPCS